MPALSVLKRSLLVVWIPTIFGVLLTARLFLLMATFSSRDSAWVIALGSSFAVSLVPSLGWWALMESIWKWGGCRIRTGWVAILGGGLLGGLLAFIVSLLIHASRFRLRGAGEFFVIGSVCGALLGALLFPAARWAKQGARTSSPASGQSVDLFRGMMIVLASVVGSGVFLAAGFTIMRWYASHLPNDEHALREFAEHREAYNRLVALVQNDHSVRYVGPDGAVNPQPPLHPGRIVPEYQRFLKEIGAKAIVVGEDGTIEFELWGSGGAIMSDSYKGVRYASTASMQTKRQSWTPTVVQNLNDEKVPHENGRVASGLYIVPIEGNWSIYRFEYQE